MISIFLTFQLYFKGEELLESGVYSGVYSILYKKVKSVEAKIQ